MSLTEFAVSPSAITADTALAVTNNGAMAQNLVTVGTGIETPMLNPGQSASLDVSALAEGTCEIFCSVAGHKEAGMVGTWTVGAGGGLDLAAGERDTVVVSPAVPGVWAFHCHVLTHAEGPDGMFGMVTALIVE